MNRIWKKKNIKENLKISDKEKTNYYENIYPSFAIIVLQLHIN